MSAGDPTFEVTLGFTPDALAIADPDHPGLRRAGERAGAPYGADGVEYHRCGATDLCEADTVPPDLFDFGFDMVDLTSHGSLQEVFARVAAAGHITDEDGTAIRTALDGATLDSAAGRSLEVVHIAEEGLIMRTSGPNGLNLGGSRPTGMNGHGVATSIHADQDVYGTPLKQLMDGRAPTLLRHDSPDGHNHDASLMLVNLWVPLHQITQPLVLGDGRSIDRRRHQLRYGIRTTSFLERDDDMAINDIWAFLHDEGQCWYLRSELDHRSAWVFNTLGTPHGAATLPGEDLAEQCYLALERAESAVEVGDEAALAREVEPVRRLAIPDSVTPALSEALAAMITLAVDAGDDPAAVCDEQARAWLVASKSARRRVTRSSLELRLVVSVSSERMAASG